MQIPPKSFLATDIVIVAGTARPGGSQVQRRRVIQISEVRKRETEENLFQDLLLYEESQDKLMETEAFNYRSERIGSIAASWSMSLEEGIENIWARAKYREIMVDYAREHKKPQLLSAEWTSKSNTAFWNIIEKSARSGKIDHEQVLEDWKKWFEKSALYA
jgi:aspartate aminotransferase-like enzyme